MFYQLLTDNSALVAHSWWSLRKALGSNAESIKEANIKKKSIYLYYTIIGELKQNKVCH